MQILGVYGLDVIVYSLTGALFDIETHWVLSLCLKAFDQFVSQQVPYQNLEVIRSLVNLAGMGTRLSKNWISSDLEVGLLLLSLFIILCRWARKDYDI